MEQNSIKEIGVPGASLRDRSQYIDNYLAGFDGFKLWDRPDFYISKDKKQIVCVRGSNAFRERYKSKNETKFV